MEVANGKKDGNCIIIVPVGKGTIIIQLTNRVERRQSPAKLRRNYFVHNRCVISRVNLSYREIKCLV